MGPRRPTRPILKNRARKQASKEFGAASSKPYRPKSRDEIARNMSAIRSRDNRTEVALRRLLHVAGLRFRLHSKRLIGKPDIVFSRQRVVVFVDGDFWHARTLREEGLAALQARIKTPTQQYWLSKFARRVQRDDEVNKLLRKSGWKVLRFWESEVKANVSATAERIERAVRAEARGQPKSRGRKASR